MKRPDHNHPLHHLHDGHPFEGWLHGRLRFDPEALETDGAPTAVRRLAFASVVGMAGLLAVDLTIVNVALPSILGDLGGGIETVQWIASVYSLAFAVFLIPGGRVADTLGHRRVFLAGTTVYTLASVLAAFAPSATVLIAARALQGLGAALVSPPVIGLTARVFPPERRNVAFGVSAAALATASGLGPLVGGVFTATLGWRWVFAIGAVIAPIALLGMSLVPKTIDTPRTERYQPDLRGIALFALAVGLVQVALVENQSLGWWPFPLLALAAACIAAAFLVRHDRNQEEGLLDVRLFRKRVVTGSVLAKFASSFGYFGTLLYVVLFLEGTLGLSPVRVGLILLAPTVLGIVLAPLVGKALAPGTTRPLIVSGLVLSAGGIILIASLASQSRPGLHILPGLAMNAIGFSMVTVPTKVAPLHELPASLHGRSAALIGTTGKLAAGFGVALSAAFFHAFSASEADSAVDDVRSLTSEQARACLGVDDVEACVDDLIAENPSLRGTRSQTIDAITTVFENTLTSTLLVIGSISLVVSTAVWWLLRPE